MTSSKSVLFWQVLAQDQQEQGNSDNFVTSRHNMWCKVWSMIWHLMLLVPIYIHKLFYYRQGTSLQIIRSCNFIRPTVNSRYVFSLVVNFCRLICFICHTPNYLCNQFLSPLTLWVQITFGRGTLDTTLCDNLCQ
jgi:hypothetical protein